ncbi:MAG: hypothetical protein HY307_01080 [Arcobacter sp.]|nr:hypothetical protein [Arcobacter sp.]
MIILGHPLLKCDTFSQINNKQDIKNTPSNSVVLATYGLEIMEYCYENNIPYGVFVTSITEAIFANNLRAKYLIVEMVTAKQIQNIAENYMFDSKVIVVIDGDDFIDEVAQNGIDGVIYRDFLEKIGETR